MKLLIVSALCVMMVLISAAALSDEEANNGTKGLIRPEEHHIVKRSTSCPMGWTTTDYNRCIFYVLQPMTWAEAQRFCESMDAHLASVHSLSEYQVIQRLIFDATLTNKLAWIGGSDAQQNGYWFWIDGTRFNYKNWCKSEPNNLWFVEHCIVINYSGSACWNDQSCHDRLPSVCARKI